MKIKDTIFYKLLKPVVFLYIKIFYRPTIIGLENIPKTGRVILAGNHTKWLDPVMLVGITKRQIHFLTKDELFHGVTKPIIKAMGCIPVNRRIHDHDALNKAYEFLNNDLCVGIFPEGTINRTDDIIMPFKYGAVKAGSKTNSPIVLFIITGEYKLFRRGIKIEFLKPLDISSNLEIENNRIMELVKEKLIEGRK